MKKHISVFLFFLLSISLFFSWAVWEGNALHSKYPDPSIQTYHYGETLQIGNYQITFQGWQWGNDSLIKTRFPDFSLVPSGADGTSEDVRIGLISIFVEKVCEGDDTLDLANVGFSSGAWGNQFDAELFFLLNSELGNMKLDLTVGETQQVTFPLTVRESQFTAKQWADIDNRKFYVNFQYYPEHIRFLCP